jgi:hypothetical protein
MSAYRASAAFLLCALLGCASSRPPDAGFVALEPGTPQRAALPDELERAASRALALALADESDAAMQVVSRLREAEQRHSASGSAASGLAQWTEHAVMASQGLDDYLPFAAGELERGELDPVLQARIERLTEEQPLAVANRALAAERRFRVASAVNRITSPLTRLALGGGIEAIETGRAALRSLLLVHHFPKASARERRASRAYGEFLARHPDDPRAPEARAEAERLDSKLAAVRVQTALKSSRRALARGQPDAARAYLERAERSGGPATELDALRREIEALRAARERALASALSASPEPGTAADAEWAAAILLSAPAEPPQAPEGSSATPAERRFVEALALRAPGRDDEFFAALRELTSLPGPNPMARHAQRLLDDPQQNPYRFYLETRREQRARLARWVVLGPLARGPARRDLPRPLEYLLAATALPVTLISLPVRLLQVPSATRAANPVVLRAGERYLARFPDGAHAASMHGRLEGRSAAAGLYTRALEHNRARSGSARAALRYRELLAAGLLEAAPRERRRDMRVALYAELLSQYGDTSSAERARRELRELIGQSSPQQIRLSREFLLENRALLAPDALGVRPELLDGEDGNGELAEAGITLLGQRWVQIALEDRDPLRERVPAGNLARLAALLDETAYRSLAADPREKAAADPQRDAFLERARLGLLDEPERRVSARSEAEYLSEREKYGWVRARGSILPFELVVSGDLESLGLGAAPRLRLPESQPDAFLYE